MNILPGIIENIESFEGISLIDISIDEDEFCSLIINSEATDEYIKPGNKVNMLFKETEISLKCFHDKLVKRQNKAVTAVKSIIEGKILSEIKLDYKGHLLSAIVLTRTLNQLDLKPGHKAVMILRTQEILLSKYSEISK